MSEQQRTTYRSLRFYKPMPGGNGAAFQFRMSTKRKHRDDKNPAPCLMIEACTQSGPKPRPGSTESPFNWNDDKVIMMFNVHECGEIAAYVVGLDRTTKVLECLHDQEREDGDNQSKFTLTKPKPDDKYGNWGVTIRRGDKSARMFMSPGQILQVKTLCEEIIRRYATEEITLNARTTVPANESRSGQSF